MRAWIVVSALTLAAAGPALAGEIVYRNGTRLQGELANEVLLVATGEDVVELAAARIALVTPTEVRLTDGRVVRGIVVGGQIMTRTALGELSVKLDDLVSFRVAAQAPAPPAPPVPPAGMLQIDRVDVQILGEAPAQVQVRAQGMLLDGCTSLGPVTQRRRGNVVTVTIATVSSAATVCTQVAQLVDTIVRLEGSFTSGAYRVRVNGIERSFRVG